MEVARGRVMAFDGEAGHGEVEAEDGRRLFLHCSAVADGSRAVPTGAEVAFAVAPGHRGRWEAASLVVLRADVDQGADSAPPAAGSPA